MKMERNWYNNTIQCKQFSLFFNSIIMYCILYIIQNFELNKCLVLLFFVFALHLLAKKKIKFTNAAPACRRSTLKLHDSTSNRNRLSLFILVFFLVDLLYIFFLSLFSIDTSSFNFRPNLIGPPKPLGGFIKLPQTTTKAL